MLSLITLHIVTEKRKLCNYKGVGLVRVFSFLFFLLRGTCLAAGNKRLYQVKKQIYRKLGCLSGKKKHPEDGLAEPEEEQTEG